MIDQAVTREFTEGDFAFGILTSTRPSIGRRSFPTVPTLAAVSCPSGLSTRCYMAAFSRFIRLTSCSLVSALGTSPSTAISNGSRHTHRIFSNRFMPIAPAPLTRPRCMTRDDAFFGRLKLDSSLTLSRGFHRMFSNSVSTTCRPVHPIN